MAHVAIGYSNHIVSVGVVGMSLLVIMASSSSASGVVPSTKVGVPLSPVRSLVSHYMSLVLASVSPVGSSIKAGVHVASCASGDAPVLVL